MGLPAFVHDLVERNDYMHDLVERNDYSVGE
jgi:hypothetical protein